MKYKKTLADLEKVAIKWWPKALEAEVAKASVIPKLLETQDQFISVLKLAGSRPEQVFGLIEAGNLSANLFLKHLVVLADYGGEPIQRLGKEFADIFPVLLKCLSYSTQTVSRSPWLPATPTNWACCTAGACGTSHRESVRVFKGIPIRLRTTPWMYMRTDSLEIPFLCL